MTIPRNQSGPPTQLLASLEGVAFRAQPELCVLVCNRR
jgi:hypothetical protein